MRISILRAGFRALLFLPLLGGCSAVDDSPPPDFNVHPVTVTPAKQWAGDSITLSSAAFAAWPGDSFPLLFGDDVLITAHRTGDSTYSVLLPDTLQGGHYL